MCQADCSSKIRNSSLPDQERLVPRTLPGRALTGNASIAHLVERLPCKQLSGVRVLVEACNQFGQEP